MKKFLKLFFYIFFLIPFLPQVYAAEKVEYLTTDWSFKGLFGKFDRSALQRGYHVYTEVCSSCHSMKYLSYRNLAQEGGPEFTEAKFGVPPKTGSVILKGIGRVFSLSPNIGNITKKCKK